MNDYIAYHSVEVMGRDYELGAKARFLTRKPEKQLRAALGGSAWVIVGHREEGRMHYRLEGSFTPSRLKRTGDGWALEGRGAPLRPAPDVTGLPWFSVLLQEQNNFSFGFSRIKALAVVSALTTMTHKGPADALGRGGANPAGGPTATPGPSFMDSCIYTIVNRDKLDEVARAGTALVYEERRPWRSGGALLAEAKRIGKALPILLGDAKDCSQLLYWGVLEKIAVGETETVYAVDRLRPIPGKRSPQELVLCSSGRFIADGFIRPYAICRTPDFLLEVDQQIAASSLPSQEGRAGEQNFLEGAPTEITLNAYERNPLARRQCIDCYGCRCFVCGFDFEAQYGARGAGFIQVHHLVPLSQIGAEYTVDPILDLRPVCPNCHAMIHVGQPDLQLDDLKALLKA